MSLLELSFNFRCSIALGLCLLEHIVLWLGLIIYHILDELHIAIVVDQVLIRDFHHRLLSNRE